MQKIKLVYNIIGRHGPGNNSLLPDLNELEYLHNNKYVLEPTSHLQNILDYRNNDLFELCTPYSLRADDNFLYELPWNTRAHGATAFSEMAGAVLEGIKHGNGYIVINDSVDPLEIIRVEDFLQIADAHDIPREKIIFLTGAIDIDNIENPWGIKIIVADWNEMVISQAVNSFVDFNPSQHKSNKFICLNRMWQHHRVHFLWKLWKLDLLKHFAISFLKTEPVTGVSYTEKLPQLAMNFFTGEELTTIEHDAKIIDETLLPLVVDDTSKLNVHQSHSYLEEHTKYYFYVVSETTFYSWNNNSFNGVHASEKVFKPMLYKMPFIVIGPAGVLKALRKKGYMTFNSLIDESYDDIKDDRLRFAKILELISDISSKSSDDLDRISTAAAKIADFNFNRLRVRGDMARKELIGKFLNLFGKHNESCFNNGWI